MIAAMTFALTSCDSEEAESVQVGIILPTKNEPRWLQDEASFKDALEDAGFTSEVMFSESSSSVELSNVEALLEKNIQVLVICPQDSIASAAAVQKAKDAGVTVISYDRLITGTDAVDYYVTFRNYAVGVAQGQCLIDAYKGQTEVPLFLYAGAVTDNNPFYFFAGAWSVLGKAVAEGQFVVQNCPALDEYIGKDLDPNVDRSTLAAILGTITTSWDTGIAASIAKSNLASISGDMKGDVAILAPNDPTARAIADVFYAHPAVSSYVITGQDAELASLKYIQEGRQTMTVWKDTSVLCPATCKMVDDILNDQEPETDTNYNNMVK